MPVLLRLSGEAGLRQMLRQHRSGRRARRRSQPTRDSYRMQSVERSPGVHGTPPCRVPWTAIAGGTPARTPHEAVACRLPRQSGRPPGRSSRISTKTLR